MVKALNSLGNPEFLNGKLATGLEHRNEAQLPNTVAHGATSADLAPELVLNEIIEEDRLDNIVEEARLGTGATGAAIALVGGEGMVCRATTGPDAPDLGVGLDPRVGLSGACIQTRQIQQCNDTEIDPRVDHACSRRLGVRSILIVPLMDGDELFGVFEILSTRPNAFDQRHLCTLQALTYRILENKRQAWEATATLPRRGSGYFLHKLEEGLPQGKTYPSESDYRFPRQERPSTRYKIWAAILGVSLIGATVLLDPSVGLRLGWRKATLGSRGSLLHRASALSKTENTDRTVLPDKEPELSSAPTKKSRQPAAADPIPKRVMSSGTKVPAQPLNGRLTGAPSPILDSQTSQPSPGLEIEQGTTIVAPTSVPSTQLENSATGPLTYSMQPQYPSEAREKHIQGPVVLEAQISREGRVQKLVIIQGNPLLAKAAMRAVKQWRYQSYFVAGHAVEMQTRITVNFTLPRD